MAIRGAFLSVFDEVKGRNLAHQWPEDVVSAEEFNAIAEYVLPKPDVCGQLVSVSAFGSTVVGFPIYLGSYNYRRNALHLNLCLVLDEAAPEEEEAIGAVVAKLARALVSLEAEASHLSDRQRRAQFATHLPTLVRELNGARQCSLVVDAANTIHLRLAPAERARTPPVAPHDVPVLVCAVGSEMLAADFALRCVLVYVDGRSHAQEIARAAGMDLGWCLEVLTDLVHLGCVCLIDWYCAHNAYAHTARLSELARSEEAQLACATHSKQSGRPAPHFRTVFALYCRLSPRTDCGWLSVAAACTELRAEAEGEADPLLDVHVQRSIQFGVLNRYLRRVHAYPRLEPACAEGDARLCGLPARLLDGSHRDDELACALELSQQALRERLDGLCAWVYRADPECSVQSQL